jgi:nudix motif 8
MLSAMTSIPHDFDDDERARIAARLRGTAVRRLSVDGPRASVLVPLCRRGGAPAVLFTKRTETVGTHKGQVSFPGGRRDPEDSDDVACALRELEEELGIPAARVDVIGVFHEVMSITSVRVTPVIGWLGDVERLALVPAPAEIDAVFTLTLAELVHPEKREVRQLGTRRAPFFTAGPHPVWGLTAFILDEIMRDVLGIDLPPLE